MYSIVYAEYILFYSILFPIFRTVLHKYVYKDVTLAALSRTISPDSDNDDDC